MLRLVRLSQQLTRTTTTTTARALMSAVASRNAPPITIDCEYQNEPLTAAAYLLIEGNKAAFVDNNTNHSVPTLLSTLKKHGLTTDNVQYIIVTHAHLDHAGGTGLLASQCPNATVLAHPRTAPHMVDPSRLIQGVMGVYGPERYKELYGDLLPIPSQRVKAVDDNETVDFGDNGRKLQFLHTRGHAKHHMIIHDHGSNSVFTGDAFGVGYADLCMQNYKKHHPQASNATDAIFLFPSTSPVDFEPEEALATLDKLKATNANGYYLTHFDRWPLPVDKGIEQMRNGILFHSQVMDEVQAKIAAGTPNDAALFEVTHAKVASWFRAEMSRRGLSVDELWALHALDVELNAQGIIAAAAFRYKQQQQKK